MKLIPLSKKTEVFAIVDDEDYEALMRLKWHYSGGYPTHSYLKPDKSGTATIQMGRYLLGLVPGDGLQCDHINRNRLDNRRANLRAVDHAANSQNIGARGGTSEHRGVFWVKRTKKWRATAMVRRKLHVLGDFADEAEAANAAWEFRKHHMPHSAEASEPA